MKKFLSLIFVSLFLAIFIVYNATKPTTTNLYSNNDILRIHIRANSNNLEDQNIKYQIKDLLLEYVSKDIIDLNSKKQVEKYFLTNKNNIEFLINSFLKDNNFNYKSNLELKNEYFPTRVYGNTIVNSGNYDSVIISLGETKGENWWCIAYPTLCFEDYENFGNDIVYKSRLLDIINKIFN